MVDAQTGDQTIGEKFAEQAMSFRKHSGIFHAQTDEIVDVEKAAVINLLSRDSPEGQAVGLLFQQFMIS